MPPYRNYFTSVIISHFPDGADKIIADVDSHFRSIAPDTAFAATSSTSVSVNSSFSTKLSVSPICIVGSPLNLNASGVSSYSWKGPNGFKSSSATPSKAKTVANKDGLYLIQAQSKDGKQTKRVVKME